MSRAAWGLCLAVVGLLGGIYLDFRIMPNQSSRALPALALVEEGTSRIDRHHEVTEDKAAVGGHYYSDKAPLSSWLVVPLYALARPLVRHLEPEVRLKVAISLGAALCGTLPFLLAFWLTLRACRRHLPPARALLLCLLGHFGSYLFVYSGVYFGHLLAGLLLLLAYLQLWERGRPLRAGLLLGLAVLAEYPLLLAAAAWAAQLALGRAVPPRSGQECEARPGYLTAGRLLLGLLPGLLALGLHNLSVTGSVLTLPYQFVQHQQFAGMRSNLGLGLPRPEALLGLTLGASRGLFIYSPILLVLLALGVGELGPGGPLRRLKAALLHPVACPGLLLLLLFSGYYMWWGGWSYGPRHLLPLAMLGLYSGCELVARRGLIWRPLLLLSGGLGVGLGWITKATHGFLIPSKHPFPPAEPLLTDFLSGNWSPFNLLSGYLGTSPKLVSACWPALFLALVAYLYWRDRQGHSREEYKK